MGIAINVLLFVTAFFCLAVGITAATSFRMLPWLVGSVSRPRLWGAGYTLFGVVVLYHAVVELVHVDPAVELVMTAVTTATALVGLGMMWSAQRVGRAARSPDTGPGATE
ncbi:hypothetical protein OG562_04240 [Streptomyces sp. NBC_01275]|uniref:hypothetical protein n=1 Tax=Streptomyces sp. NBC_01275 TaxID=2903807 RepID=UPI00224CFC00|nr:hypothetical protein [Streptomyces sp. NBC_01275]MCX4760202.1 hypothetical protein [Streptomyces sp. NBC_01275]